MIRQQQAQLQQIQQHAGLTASTNTGAVDDSTPTSERSFSFPSVPGNLPMTVTNPRPRSPVPRSSMELSRQSSRRSRTPSRTGSPALRPLSAGLQAQGDDWFLSSGSQGSRDESAFYQAETQMLTRENQMLRLRIRELGTSLFVCSWIYVLTTGRTADQRRELSNCEYSRHAIKFDKSPNRRRTFTGDFRRSGHGSREQRLRCFVLLDECKILQLAIGHGKGGMDFYLIKRALRAGVIGPFMSHTPGIFCPNSSSQITKTFS